MDLKQAKDILNKYGIRPDNALGQNFLVSDSKAQAIVDAAGINKGDTVIEIGPGLGALTRKIIGMGVKLVLVEKDSRMIPVLEDIAPGSGDMQIVHGDVLETDLKKYIKKDENIKILSNLPYSITTLLITKLTVEMSFCERMVLTMQNEAANKLLCSVGSKEYTVISALAGYYFHINRVMRISAGNFYPCPDVESATLSFTSRGREDEVCPDEFLDFLKTVFSKRRKTLVNVLSDKVDREYLANVLRKGGIDPKARAQELTPEQFMYIARETAK